MDVVESPIGHDDHLVPVGRLCGHELHYFVCRVERVGSAPTPLQGLHDPFGRQSLGWIQTDGRWTGATIAMSAKPSAAPNSCSNRDRREV